MPTNQNKLLKLEAIRGFAALYVALGHIFLNGIIRLPEKISILFRFGQEAVILFFLLSGFVIQYAYSKSKDKSFKTFFSKRFFRIYIPLIVVFTTNYFLLAFENKAFLPLDIGNLVGNLLMLQDASFLKPNVICDTFLGNQPLWSLSYEWWFYMIFFFISNSKINNQSLFVYIAGTLATLTYIFYPNFFNRELMYLIIWWVGADLAKLYINGHKISVISMIFPLIFLFLNTILLYVNLKINFKPVSYGMSPFLELRHFAFAIIAVFSALMWSKIHWVGFNKTLGMFSFIAPISFGFYISHWFLVADAHYLDSFIANPYLKSIMYFIICLLFSYLVERVIYPKFNQLFFSKSVK